MQALLSLTGKELSAFRRCEKTIEKGQRTFVEVGNALLEIKTEHLYRSDYDTFEDYCKERWGFQRAHAYRLIEAAKVVENLSPIGDIAKPATESQARALSSLEPDQQAAAWQDVVDECEEKGVPITAAAVEAKVEEYKADSEPYREEPAEPEEDEPEAEESPVKPEVPSAGYAWWEKQIAALWAKRKATDQSHLVAAWLEGIAAKLRDGELI
jgi:hypothetical protein